MWFAQHHTTCQLMLSFGAKGLKLSYIWMCNISVTELHPLFRLYTMANCAPQSQFALIFASRQCKLNNIMLIFTLKLLHMWLLIAAHNSVSLIYLIFSIVKHKGDALAHNHVLTLSNTLSSLGLHIIINC